MAAPSSSCLDTTQCPPPGRSQLGATVAGQRILHPPPPERGTLPKPAGRGAGRSAAMQLGCPALLPLLLLLLLGTRLPQAESPPLHPDCHDGEYAYSGICCLMCPAGRYVDEPCLKPHTQGRCGHCTEGEDYTAHGNGLSQCLPCDECKHGKREVKRCTVKSNTICQCEDGYYCPLICEECIRCTQKCPEGKVIVRNCNATADLECGSPSKETTNPLICAVIVIVVLFVVVILAILACYLYKKKYRKVSKRDEDSLISDGRETLSPKAASSMSKDQKVKKSHDDSLSLLRNEAFESAENKYSADEDPGTVPSASLQSLPDVPAVLTGQSYVRNGELNSSAKCPEVIVKNPSHSELNKLYYDSRHTVPPHDWKVLMRRMGLSDNDIHKIIRDNSIADEQDYQMLKAIQDRYGIEEALRKLLKSLWEMKLMRIYENLLNELISNDIILKNN